MIHEDDLSKWAESLEDFKPGLIPVKCWSILMFYQLRGKTTTLLKSNMEPLRYLYYALFSPQENRYYKKLFRAWSLDDLQNNEDTAMSYLRQRVIDNNIWILYTQQQVEDTRAMLSRLYKANITTEGTLDYRLYIQILDISLRLEDYRDTGKTLTGYRTVCNQMDTELRELWAKAATPKI
jgi:hypothetical protein